MRPIDAEKSLQKVDEAFARYTEHDDILQLYSDTRLAVINAPTIDPVSIRPKGWWVMTLYTTTSKRGRVISNGKFECSECGYGNGRKKSNFCPNCGADMRGGAI